MLDPQAAALIALQGADARLARAGNPRFLGVRKLLAVIGDSANAGSIGVHRALGFIDVGIMRSVGWKFGAWRDIVLMEKTLGAGDTTSPE